jgi:hypothetical protein
MKKSTLVMASLLLAGSAFATEMPLRNVRLEMKETALSKVAPLVSIDILENGEVYGKSKSAGQLFPVPVLIERLSSDQIDQIDDLISEAATGNIVPPYPNTFRCMAKGIFKREMTADNGNVFLVSGAIPCGPTTVNDSPAAAKLTSILVQELAKCNNRRNGDVATK